MSINGVNDDLNSVIAKAVTAKIEAQVLQALSGDEVLGQYVMAALNQPIERDYGRTKTTFLKQTLDGALQNAVKVAVARVIEEEQEKIEAAVRKELRANINVIAEQLVSGVRKNADDRWGWSIKLVRGERD